MGDVVNLEMNYGTEIIGPFRGGLYRLACHGYVVPNIKLYKRNDDVDLWSIQLDERFEIDAPTDEVNRWAWLVANSMAIAAGYSCHGENCQPLNPYKCRISGIELVPGDD